MPQLATAVLAALLLAGLALWLRKTGAEAFVAFGLAMMGSDPPLVRKLALAGCGLLAVLGLVVLGAVRLADAFVALALG